MQFSDDHTPQGSKRKSDHAIFRADAHSAKRSKSDDTDGPAMAIPIQMAALLESPMLPVVCVTLAASLVYCIVERKDWWAPARPEQAFLLVSIIGQLCCCGHIPKRKRTDPNIFSTYGQITVTLMVLGGIASVIATDYFGWFSSVRSSHLTIWALVYMQFEAFPRILRKLPGGPVVPWVAVVAIIYTVFMAYRNGNWDSVEAAGLQIGSVRGVSMYFAVLSLVLDSLALIIWSVWWVKGDHGPIQRINVYMTPLSILPIACANAFREEAEYFYTFRVLLLGALLDRNPFVSASDIPWVVAANISHSVFFGLAHVAGGFPSGGMGFIMVFIWSVFLGFLRLASDGMFLVWAVHVAADVVIFVLIYTKQRAIDAGKK